MFTSAFCQKVFQTSPSTLGLKDFRFDKSCGRKTAFHSTSLLISSDKWELNANSYHDRVPCRLGRKFHLSNIYSKWKGNGMKNITENADWKMEWNRIGEGLKKE